MQDKDMVLDVLNGTKASISNYAKVITESRDLKLREQFQQLRDADEKFQYELYKIANEKGYYPTPVEATEQDITHVKSMLTSFATAQQGAGPIPTLR